MDYMPIRKVLVGAVAAGLTLALQAIGVDLGPEFVNQAAPAIVGSVMSYLVKDPRVQKAGEVVDDLHERGEVALGDHERDQRG